MPSAQQMIGADAEDEEATVVSAPSTTCGNWSSTFGLVITAMKSVISARPLSAMR